jgi:phenylalanyl-tRNA synthetase beta chain
VPARTSYAELDLDALIAAAPPTVQAPVFSPMPVAKEDIAVVVDATVAAADVQAALA